MQIRVLFFAELGEIFGSHRVVEASEGSTIRDITETFSKESKQFSLKKTSLLYAVNENFESIEKMLADQDRLAIMTPMCGG